MEIRDDSFVEKVLLEMYPDPDLSAMREAISNAAMAGEGTIHISTVGTCSVRNQQGMTREELVENFLPYGNPKNGIYGYGSKAPLAASGSFKVKTCDGTFLHEAEERVAGGGISYKIDSKEFDTYPFTEVSWNGNVSGQDVEKWIMFDDDHEYFINGKKFEPIPTLFSYGGLTFKAKQERMSASSYGQILRDLSNLKRFYVKAGPISYPINEGSSRGFCVEIDSKLTPSKDFIPERDLNRAKKKIKNLLNDEGLYVAMAQGDKVLGEMLMFLNNGSNQHFHINGDTVTTKDLIDLYLKDDYPVETLSMGNFTDEDIEEDIAGTGFYHKGGAQLFGTSSRFYSDEEIASLRNRHVTYRHGLKKTVEVDSFVEPETEWYTCDEKFYSICKKHMDIYWIERPLDGLKAKRIEDHLIEFKKDHFIRIPRCVFFTERGYIASSDPWLAMNALKENRNVKLREDLSYLTYESVKDLDCSPYERKVKSLNIFEKRFEDPEFTALKTCLMYEHVSDRLSEEAESLMMVQKRTHSIQVNGHVFVRAEERSPEVEELLEFMLKEVSCESRRKISSRENHSMERK